MLSFHGRNRALACCSTQGQGHAERSTYLTARADHRRSAMAAARGQVSCTTLLPSTHSPHMHACAASCRVNHRVTFSLPLITKGCAPFCFQR